MWWKVEYGRRKVKKLNFNRVKFSETKCVCVGEWLIGRTASYVGFFLEVFCLCVCGLENFLEFGIGIFYS